MWFWLFILVCDCLVPAVMIAAGRMMWKHCPKQINGLLGYRTTMSMKNMDTWKFAHEYAGKLWWKFGWLLLILTALLHIPFFGKGEDTIGILSVIVMGVQVIVLIASIIPTEIALRRHFYIDGTRR